MPQQIPLQPLVNQSFDVVLDNTQYTFLMRQILDILIFDLTRDNVLILSGQKCVAGAPLIPFVYLEGGKGNFIFTTQNEELPDYTQFGTTQFLYYFSPDELAAIRG